VQAEVDGGSSFSRACCYLRFDPTKHYSHHRPVQHNKHAHIPCAIFGTGTLDLSPRRLTSNHSANMDQDDSLTRLQGLQADLVAFSESRLLNVDRLWTELEDSIADFRKLLDRQNKNDRSRQALKAGTLVKTRVVETMR
jgi:hypothetical protein